MCGDGSVMVVVGGGDGGGGGGSGSGGGGRPTRKIHKNREKKETGNSLGQNGNTRVGCGTNSVGRADECRIELCYNIRAGKMWRWRVTLLSYVYIYI